MDATKAATALASPKLPKGAKSFTAYSTVPAAQYGCEHIQGMLQEKRRMFLQQYSEAIQATRDRVLIETQIHKHPSSETDYIHSLEPTYICLQCPHQYSESTRDSHAEEKGHAFFVECRSGAVWCNPCEDFIYDPTLEDLRLVSRYRRKRKHEEYIDNQDDARMIAANTQFIPCRANGLRGLYNMGQTCFMSVIIQSLIHNPFIKAYYLSEGHKSEDCEKESCISCAFEEMLAEFHSVEKVEGYGAVNLLMGSWMSAQSLAGYQQQDAHEYMQFLMHALHTENSGNEEHSQEEPDCNCIIHQSFYGKLQSRVTCDKCKNTTTAIDPVMDLSLDIRNQTKRRKVDKSDNDTKKAPKDLELKDCLERFTSREKLGAGNYTCQNCGGEQSAVKQLSVQRLPPTLPIHFKRFEHAKTTTKIETKVRFPLQLDMYPYTTHAHKNRMRSGDKPPRREIYELSSVVVHKGKADSGHYISYTRVKDDWFLFDDSKVVLSNTAEVTGAAAYMLFYVVRDVN